MSPRPTTASETVRLHPEDVQAIAETVADLLRLAAPVPHEHRWLSTEEVAAAFGRSSEWVREHAVELGGRKIGGVRAPWRFPASCLEAPSEPAPRSRPPEPKAPRQRKRRSSVALLTIKERA
jgi:hypothetical protein